MDKGEFIRRGYSVEPGDGGSFIVVQGGRRWRDDGLLSDMRGFTSFTDLLAWLAQEHSALAAGPEQAKGTDK